MSTFLRRVGGATAAHPWRTRRRLAADPRRGRSALNAAVRRRAPRRLQRSRHAVPGGHGVPARAVARAGRRRRPRGRARPGRRPTSTRPCWPSSATASPPCPACRVVDAPRLSADGDTALLAVSYDVPVTDFKGTEGIDALDGAAAPARAAGLQVELGGSVPENVPRPTAWPRRSASWPRWSSWCSRSARSSAPGCRSPSRWSASASAPRIIGLLAAVTDISGTAPTIATMVGLGVGIDYALLLVAPARRRAAPRAVGPGRGGRGDRDRRALGASWPA